MSSRRLKSLQAAAFGWLFLRFSVQTLCDDFNQQNAELCANLLQPVPQTRRQVDNCPIESN